MILASQNVQIAEEKDFVREKISGIFFVNTPPKTKRYASRAVFCFGNEAHLRCMKNEAGLRLMKRAFGSRRSNIALRFMARARRFTEAARLLLRIRATNASLTKL